MPGQYDIRIIDELSSRDMYDDVQPVSSNTWLRESASALTPKGPQAESLSDAWNAWLNQDSAYSAHPLVSTSSFWSMAHNEVLSPSRCGSPMQQRSTASLARDPSTSLSPGKPQKPSTAAASAKAAILNSAKERGVSTRAYQSFSHPLPSRETTMSSILSEQDTQRLHAAVHIDDTPNPPRESSRKAVDVIAEQPHAQRRTEPALQEPAPTPEPLTGDNTLPSPFQVESVYSGALLRNDTISTCAPASLQDTTPRMPTHTVSPRSAASTAPSSRTGTSSNPQGQDRHRTAANLCGHPLYFPVSSGPPLMQQNAYISHNAMGGPASHSYEGHQLQSTAQAHGGSGGTAAFPIFGRQQQLQNSGPHHTHEPLDSRDASETTLHNQISASGSSLLDPESSNSRIPRRSLRTPSPHISPRDPSGFLSRSISAANSQLTGNSSPALLSHSPLPAHSRSRTPHPPTSTPTRSSSQHAYIAASVMSPHSGVRGGVNSASSHSAAGNSARHRQRLWPDAGVSSYALSSDPHMQPGVARLRSGAVHAAGAPRRAHTPPPQHPDQTNRLESDVVNGPRPPPQWNNPRAPVRRGRERSAAARSCKRHPSLYSAPQPRTPAYAAPLAPSRTPSSAKHRTPPGHRSPHASHHGHWHATSRRPASLSPGGSASAFACSPFALVPPVSPHAWPKRSEVPPLFKAHHPPRSPPLLEAPPRPPGRRSGRYLTTPNSLETLHAALPQRMALRVSPEEPPLPIPRDPLTSFNEDTPAPNDDDLFSGAAPTVPTSRDRVATRGTVAGGSTSCAMTPSVGTEDDEFLIASTGTVNPYLPLFPGALGTPTKAHKRPSPPSTAGAQSVASPMHATSSASSTSETTDLAAAAKAAAHAASGHSDLSPEYFGSFTPLGAGEYKTPPFSRSADVAEAAAAAQALAGHPSHPGMCLRRAAAAALLSPPPKTNKGPASQPAYQTPPSAASTPAACAPDTPLLRTAPHPARTHGTMHASGQEHSGDTPVPKIPESSPPLLQPRAAEADPSRSRLVDIGVSGSSVTKSGAAGAQVCSRSNSNASSGGSGYMCGRGTDRTRVATPDTTTLRLRSSNGSASGPVLPALQHAEPQSTAYGSALRLSLPLHLRRAAVASRTSDAVAGGPPGPPMPHSQHSTPPSSGPLSSSLGSPASLEQLMPAFRQPYSHAAGHNGLNPDAAQSLGTLGSVTITPASIRSGSISICGGVASLRVEGEGAHGVPVATAAAGMPAPPVKHAATAGAMLATPRYMPAPEDADCDAGAANAGTEDGASTTGGLQPALSDCVELLTDGDREGGGRVARFEFHGSPQQRAVLTQATAPERFDGKVEVAAAKAEIMQQTWVGVRSGWGGAADLREDVGLGRGRAGTRIFERDMSKGSSSEAAEDRRRRRQARGRVEVAADPRQPPPRSGHFLKCCIGPPITSG